LKQLYMALKRKSLRDTKLHLPKVLDGGFLI
jgi:hypothetical protein